FEHNFDDKALVIRTRKDGDRFAPEGMNGKSQKLKDFFINSKISVPAKARQLLLCSGDEIIWIVGLRKSHHTHKKVNNGTFVHVVFSKIT
ncbi:MAG TPA: tRNA lysidine(34) synthetase TilS, partial [Saprospiraceae bacterium]|nr:tRNA lysidine(34) synthetase TilS [Saprospiraceae bacterium]